MRIKKFTADTLADATQQMRNELGPNAIVLNTRTIATEGGLDFRSGQQFEITAAIDTPTPNRSASPTYAPPSEQRKRQTAKLPPPEKPDESAIESLRRVTQQFEQRQQTVERQPAALTATADIQQLKDEMREMRETLFEIGKHIKYQRMPAVPEALKNAYAALIEQELGEELAADVIQAAYSKLRSMDVITEQAAANAVVSSIAGLIRTPEELPAKKRKAKVIAIVGPTGVGKTTTIAKLAAIDKLVHQKDVAIITADTYRIGAIEQLRTFAAIADIPMEVVYKPSEMAAAVKQFADKDVIYVDTVGRSQRSKKELAELEKFIAAATAQEVHLVVNLGSGNKQLRDIVQRFRPVGPNRLIVSKIDEAAVLGPLVAVSHASQLPISYLTIGQTVPDDIIPGDPAKIATMVFHGTSAHA